MRARESVVNKARVQRRSTDEGFFSAATEVENENVLTDFVLDDAEDPVTNIDTAILVSSLRKNCCIIQCLIRELPDHLE